MDKLEKYQKIIIEIFNEYADYYQVDDDPVIVQTIFDTDNHHYLLLHLGWDKKQFIYHVYFHLDIIDNKIWIQKNETDVLIADELIEKGIPQTDIVLGLQPPEFRKYTDFAEA